MKKEHLTLWQKIAAFTLDDPNASRPFSLKLAQEKKWTETDTQRRIVEYKKFLFLCSVLPNGASPPPLVDEVWHMHLTYTDNYWNHLCKQVLGYELHHHPSKGGPDERIKHDNWYRDTLIGYIENFEQIPPDDIWFYPNGFNATQYLPENSPFLIKNTEGVVINDESEKDYFDTQPFLKYSIYGLFGLLACAVFYPPLLVGLQFMIPYSILFAFIIIYLFLKGEHDKKQVKRQIEHAAKSFSPYIVAWLVGGRERLITTFLYETTDNCKYSPQLQTLGFELKNDETLNKNPVFTALAALDKKEVLLDFIKETVRPYGQIIENEVKNKVFLPVNVTLQERILMWLFCLIGFIRIIEGTYFHRPFGILLGCLAVFSLAFLIISQNTEINFGNWRELVRRHYKWNTANLRINHELWQFALGSAIFTTTASWYSFENNIRPPQEKHGGGGGGDSSSGCSGSSCGGSSCGGGCGGCGG
jgi:uncharacterized membrane protein YgcG